MSAGVETDPNAWSAIARSAATASRTAVTVDAERKRELLTCVLAGSAYAVPVERVREIVRMRPITPMPRTPDWMLGVISLRGEVVQVLDLCRCLNLEVSAASRSTRIIVLHGDDDRVTGLLVDGVREVLRVDADAFRISTAADARGVRELCKNGEEFVSVLDLDRVTGVGSDD